MNDKLKHVLEERRALFDVYEIDVDQLWPEIERGVARKRSLEVKWIWRVAAAVVVGIGISMVAYQVNQTAAFRIDELAYRISPEWAETEQFYAGRIDEKLQAIRASHVELDPLILEDIKLLDEAFIELKRDLADGADNEEVINAMISNYQVKLEILERILVEIKENDAIENGENFEL